jgi:hypothetical protein
MAKKKKQKRPWWEPVVKTVTVLVTLALIFLLGKTVVTRFVFFTGGIPVILSSDPIDLRDSQVSIEDYKKLRDERPDSHILWSVPVSGQYFESTSEYIFLEKLEEADISNFSYFENLKTVNAMNCADHKALARLESAFPALTVEWAIHLGGEIWSREADRIDLRDKDVTCQELMDVLGYFREGTQIRLGEYALTEEEKDILSEAFPDLRIYWGVELMGQVYSSGIKKLDIAGENVDLEGLIAVADQFSDIQEIDLSGCGLGLQQLLQLQEAYPNVLIRSELTLHGQEVTTAAEEIDLSGIRMENTDEIEMALKVMPNLKKVIMSDCGFSNEQMDALNKRHENVLFVWTVKFDIYELRTDAVGFCASDVPKLGYIAPKLTSEDLQPLKYCTELVALDLGHMHYTDLSVLENMHKLEYLILVDAWYTDISVLAQMENLKYLELFKNKLDDLTPLLECKNLKHLNIGYTRGFDPEVLKQMTWLERLWFPGHGLSQEKKQEIVDALPNTEVYMPAWDVDGSTGGDWRKADVYYEMRDLFGMFYQPGGTGTDNN